MFSKIKENVVRRLVLFAMLQLSFVSGITEALDSHLSFCIRAAVEAQVMWSLQNPLHTWDG